MLILYLMQATHFKQIGGRATKHWGSCGMLQKKHSTGKQIDWCQLIAWWLISVRVSCSSEDGGRFATFYHLAKHSLFENDCILFSHFLETLGTVCRLTSLFVHAALVGFESNNKYEVRNVMGQNVFYAVEENDCLSRQCCGPLRPFSIHVLDNFGQEIITVTRPLKCMSCFFPCCLQEVNETTLGYANYVLCNATVPCEDMTTNHTVLPHSWRCRLHLVTQ